MAIDLTDVTQLAFFITSFYIIITMFLALTLDRVMQAAYWLIMMLIGVGVIFLLANSEIIFAFQVSIYGGGIAVLLLFAVLLTEHDQQVFPDSAGEFMRATWSQIAIFLLMLGNLIILITTTVTDSDYIASIPERTGPTQLGDTSRPVYDTVDDIGAFTVTKNYAYYLWDTFGNVIPFLAMLLLAALLGSIKIVIREWEIEDLSDKMKQHIEAQEAEL
jgi:NADH-quinone oxidoreductase subunit J